MNSRFGMWPCPRDAKHGAWWRKKAPPKNWKCPFCVRGRAPKKLRKAA